MAYPVGHQRRSDTGPGHFDLRRSAPFSLQVAQADGTVYCYRRNSSTGSDLIRDRCAPAGGFPQPNCATPETRSLLSGSPAGLTTVTGATLDGLGGCGATAGFCPGITVWAEFSLMAAKV